MPRQFSQRGSPSVSSEDEEGRLFVAPSRPPAKLPDDLEWSTSGPAIHHHDITPVMSRVVFLWFIELEYETSRGTTRALVFWLLI